jgi:predicted transcriptional regulator
MSGLDGAPPCHVTLAVNIVEAYVQHNAIEPMSLPPLVKALSETLKALCASQGDLSAASQVPIEHTIGADYIISLEDGQRYKSLKRHLASRGLTPEQYREKWGLKPDYPMAAPAFSAARANQARAREHAKRKRATAQPKDKAGTPQSTPISG